MSSKKEKTASIPPRERFVGLTDSGTVGSEETEKLD